MTSTPVVIARPAPVQQRDIRRLGVAAILVAVLTIVVVLSLMLGARAIDPAQVLGALLAPEPGNADQVVVRDLRVPRTMIGLAVGAALGLAGTVAQALTRNPLADPGLLGVNAGASLVVVLGLTFFGVSTTFGQVWLAFLGAALATVLVYAVASGRHGPTPISLTLAGAAVTAGCTSLITLMLLTDLDTLNNYRFWVVGSLAGRSLDSLAALLPFLVAGAVLALVLGRSLSITAMGADVARSLGVHLGRARVLSAIAVVLLCGSATALAGPIVFVGLAVPHIVRRLVGAELRWVLALSLIAGPILIISADVIGRLIAPPAEIEAGLIVAFLGAPVMIALVRSRKARSL